MIAMEMIHKQTSPVGRDAIVRAVFSTITPHGAVREGLRNRGLVDASGYPTQLGREYATWLINIGDRR